MVKQTRHNAGNGVKAAMEQMSLPETDLAVENAALRAKVSQLEAENAALRAKLEATHQPTQAAAAPVPAKIEPLPKELEQTLGRDAIWALVRPEDGKDSRSVLERHGEIWARFDKVIGDFGAEAAKVLRKPLQDYLDGLVGLQFSREEKHNIVKQLNLMTRSLGLRASYRGAVGPLIDNGPSLRIQASSRLPSGKEKKTYTSLGTVFPPGVELADEPQRLVNTMRRVPKSYRDRVPALKRKDSREE